MIHVWYTKFRRHWNSLYAITELQHSFANVFLLRLTRSLSFVTALLVGNAKEKLNVGGRLAQYKIHPSLSPRPSCLPRRGRVQVRVTFGWNWLKSFINIYYKHNGRQAEEMNAASACVYCCWIPSPNIGRLIVLILGFILHFLFPLFC
jgi:hypothetical protein